MKSTAKYFSLFLLLMVYAFSLSGCAKGPVDDEVIKAVNENKYFKGGVGVFTFQGPIVVLGKGSRNKDGSWPVKVKVLLDKKQGAAPVELTPTFNLYKSQDREGKITWRAELN